MIQIPNVLKTQYELMELGWWGNGTEFAILRTDHPLMSLTYTFCAMLSVMSKFWKWGGRCILQSACLLIVSRLHGPFVLLAIVTHVIHRFMFDCCTYLYIYLYNGAWDITLSHIRRGRQKGIIAETTFLLPHLVYATDEFTFPAEPYRSKSAKLFDSGLISLTVDALLSCLYLNYAQCPIFNV